MSVPAAASTSQRVTLPLIPELYTPDFLEILLPSNENAVHNPPMVDSTTSEVRNPMMDALKATAHRTFTENGAPAYSSTTSPLLDAFQGLRPHARGDNIFPLLDRAWKEDPELTLRIIWNARSIHDGKGEREVFYQAFGWLFEHHPRTAVENLPRLVEPLCTLPRKSQAMPHGYWKDLLNIVSLAAKNELHPWKNIPNFLHAPTGHTYIPDDETRVHRSRLRGGCGNPRRWFHSVPAKGPQPTKLQRADSHHARLERKLQEPKFRALYIMVARLFAERLAQDSAILDQLEGEAKGSEAWQMLSQRLSLVGKWAPTPHGSHDRVTNLSTAICLLLHDAGVFSCLRVDVSRDTVVPALKTHILRSYLQRWVLTPLRRALAVPEPLMSAKRWQDIDYSRVASTCMKNDMEVFYQHDPEGFEAFLVKVETGRKKISGATLMPHEIVEAVREFNNHNRLLSWELRRKLRLRVLEGQWASLVQRLREAGKLDSALAVCDVSGSMYGKPILVALALSLVTAQLAKPPFSNGFITFSRTPQFQLVDIEKVGLAQTLNEMERSEWDMNTDLHAVFVELLLPLAVENKVKPEDMIKTIFVFSDMQFDKATCVDNNVPWETTHDSIERAYREAGYEVPRIVYWDLAAHDVRSHGLSAIPVTSDKRGVALMNGFSPAMLKVFMGDADVSENVSSDLGGGQWEKVEDASRVLADEDDFTPLSVMKKAVMKKSFDGLVVVD